jgi:hypothetical protein
MLYTIILVLIINMYLKENIYNYIGVDIVDKT